MISRHFKIVLGYFLLALGLVGLLLPILPGWLFIIPGVALVGEESWVGRAISKRLPQKIRDRLR